MRSTIKDVAKKANVSTATVSLVIHENKRISTDTRRKVFKAIKELNYHPSHSARGLVSRQTGNIGFILTDDHFLRTEPFYTRIFLGTEFEARESAYYILLTTIPSSFKEGDPLPRFVLEGNVDGIIIAGKVPAYIISKLNSYKMPLTFVDYYPPFGDYSAILIDNLNGGLQAVEHLISLGHQKIAFIGGDIEHPSIRDRFLGYKTALEKKGLNFDSAKVVTTESDTSRESGYQAAKRLFQNTTDLTSIFACNDAMAIGAMQYLKTKGYRIPQDISIIGFDDVEAGLSTNPSLSTMKVPKIEMGAKIMQLMSDILKNKTKTAVKVLVSVELITRESTAAVSDND